METDNYELELYQKLPQMVLGFHGCDKEVALKILNSSSEHLKASDNDYDWLGEGIYFWLNDPKRAYEWAVSCHKRNPQKIKEPYVIGAIIDLGNCLNFCERQSIKLLQRAYDELGVVMKMSGIDLSDLKNKVPDEGGFKLLRPLDCAVITYLHKMMSQKRVSFDTVYGYFQEGKDAFIGCGIKEKSHIQICVRNTNCIKGYFLPRQIELSKTK